MKKNIFIKKIIITCLVLIFVFLAIPKTSSATYFGGMKVGQWYCNCSNSWLLFIRDYSSGGILFLVYTPGSSRLLTGNPLTGINQIGSYTPGAGQCRFYVGYSCYTFPTDGLIGGGSPGFGTN